MSYYQQAMAAMGEVIRRLRRDIASGQALHGLKFDEKFDERNDKADSLPHIRIVDYSMQEQHAGTPESGAGINSILRQNQEFVIQLVCDERNGWLTDTTVTNMRKMGALNIANMIMDCIELNDQSEKDLTLDNKLDAPVMFHIRESGVLQLGIVIDITVMIKTRLFRRAERSPRALGV